MDTIISLKEIQKIVLEFHDIGKSIGFIPTMGALHEGHLQLVRESKKANDITVVSIFVNPKQFGPKEDLSKYPRPIEQDKKLLDMEGADYLFYPNANEIYPSDFQTSIAVDKVANILEGKSRPGHFDGMATVVLKLFNVVSPTNVYFGQKDFQQCIIVRQMIKDLNLQIKFHIVPTVRDEDGLALSSRNIFLNSQERLQALNLYQSLLLAKKLIAEETKNVEFIKTKMKNYLQKYKLIHLDYIEICNPEKLTPVQVVSKKAVILIAAFVGKTRLIDNIII